MEAKALRSLIKHSGESDPVYLQATTDRNVVDIKQASPVMIKLAHRLHSPLELTICLIVKDGEQEETSKSLNKTGSVTEDMFSQIVSISKLKTKLRSSQKLDEFRKNIDLVLADHRIVDKLPNILGRAFYKSGRDMPVPVRLHKPYDSNDTVAAKMLARTTVDATFVRHQVRLATKCAAMALTPSTCLSIHVGYTSMPFDELLENVKRAQKDMKERIESKAKVRAFHIKTPESVALPL